MAKAKSRYFRQDDPPPMGKVLHVQKISDAKRWTVIALAEKQFGVFTHFCTRWKRTIRCTKHLGRCDYCSNAVAQRWAGFLHVCDTTGRAEGLIELTLYAGNQLKTIIRERGFLRGLILSVYRERGHNKSPLVILDVGLHDGRFELPTERSPEPTLDRLWTLAPLNDSKPHV